MTYEYLIFTQSLWLGSKIYALFEKEKRVCENFDEISIASPLRTAIKLKTLLLLNYLPFISEKPENMKKY